MRYKNIVDFGSGLLPTRIKSSGAHQPKVQFTHLTWEE